MSLYVTPPALFPYTTLFRSVPALHRHGDLSLLAGLEARRRVEHDRGQFVHELDVCEQLLAVKLMRSEENTSELKSRNHHVCCQLLEKKTILRQFTRISNA